MACSLPCCGSFCLFVSIICAVMQFVFYALLEGNSERIDIGSSEEDRAEYADTALYTGFIYTGLIVVSVICLIAGGQRKSYDPIRNSDEEESRHLINSDDKSNHYESNGSQQPISSGIVNEMGSINQ